MGDVKPPFQAADDKAKAKRKKIALARQKAMAEADQREVEFLRTQQANLKAEFLARQENRAA